MSLTEDKRWETFCAFVLAATPPEALIDGCRFGPFSSFADPDLKSSISQNGVCLIMSRGAPSLLLLLLLTHLESRRAVEQPRSVISNSWGLSWQPRILARSRSEHVRSLFGPRRRCERWKVPGVRMPLSPFVWGFKEKFETKCCAVDSQKEKFEKRSKRLTGKSNISTQDFLPFRSFALMHFQQYLWCFLFLLYSGFNFGCASQVSEGI